MPTHISIRYLRVMKRGNCMKTGPDKSNGKSKGHTLPPLSAYSDKALIKELLARATGRNRFGSAKQKHSAGDLNKLAENIRKELELVASIEPQGRPGLYLEDK